MPYIIDGHNLIPKIQGLSLQAIDDEVQLIEQLQEFCRQTRKNVEVYFDNAPLDGVRARSYGLVTARFIRSGITADDAIRNRLVKLGRAARNWTVVSSDQAVQNSARAAQAKFLSSDTFAGMLEKTIQESLKDMREKKPIELSTEELDDWLRLFGEDQ